MAESVHECGKEREWGEVTTALKFFQEAEIRREQREIRAEEREERMIETMSVIAAQGEILNAQGETISRHDKDLREAFIRIRKVENPSLLVKLTRTKAGRVALGALVFMAFIGFIRNPEAFGKFIKAVIQ